MQATTAVKANIHYPVDWVLLRDATRTIMKAVKLIQKYGLKNRMDEPADFINAINKLCIEMTHTKGKKDSKKKRKKIYRLMKKLLRKTALHGLRHQELLENRWEETNLIIARIENVLTQLPEAIRQGHERIIGERLVRNNEKILSLYDKNIHVIVRGKAGDFCEHQKRRAQTEGRIGIIKNSFLGNPSKGKSFNSRNLSTSWSVPSHNLWVLVRLPEADALKKKKIA